MEEKFFSYKSCDRVSFKEFRYNDIILKMDIGIFKKGKRLGFATIDIDEGIMFLENMEYKIEFNLIEED